MQDIMLSASWYRVAGLTPGLRPHIRMYKRSYRGHPWFVMEDRSTGRFHRFTMPAYAFIAALNGRRTVDEVWVDIGEQLGDQALTQDEVIGVLGRLHTADLLHCRITPDAEEVFARRKKARLQKLGQRLLNPLAMRFPLFDPDSLLSRLVKIARPVFSIHGFMFWLAVVVLGLAQSFSHWPQLAETFRLQALTPRNLLLLACLYPVIKTFHEAAHALAVKVWGGEVHEIGIMLLVLMPVPYVDASSASAFDSKKRRMIVGAAGIMCELFIAATAMLIWVAAEPGLVREVAFNAALIGGLSTVFFNGNPLLRFDGYFVLADAIEMPNLGPRSNRYLGYLIQKYAFGVNELQSHSLDPGERLWFIGYAIASFVYRMFILVAITLFVISEYLVIGVIVACWAVLTQIVVPVIKWIGFLFSSPVIHKQRGRALSVVAGSLIVVSVFTLLIPVPYYSSAAGVVWLPEDSHLRSGASSFVTRVLVENGSEVRTGQPLIETRNPFIDAELRIHQAKLRELDARYIAAQYDDLVEAQIIRDEIKVVAGKLARLGDQQNELTLRSPASGLLILPDSHDLAGSYIEKGTTVGYVVDFDNVVIRVVIPQENAGLIREETRGVNVRLASRLQDSFATVVLNAVPGATRRLPSKALGKLGGGSIAVDPFAADGVTAIQLLFQLDLAVPEAVTVAHIGERVYVRFDHGTAPIGLQWYRQFRQLFLRRIGV